VGVTNGIKISLIIIIIIIKTSVIWQKDLNLTIFQRNSHFDRPFNLMTYDITPEVVRLCTFLNQSLGFLP